MACKKCKEKKIKDIFKNTDYKPKLTILFSIVWLLFSIYGFVSFIGDLIKWIF